ncbi:hypothetical protein [Geminocystis herdmanii]|uniref:hypothetical protein n=1 Tax=Geminocystis herdmanii TaxID=669359 RepID=UPI000349D6BC|nr:hypothetical protein [Geminocystis herdmanii]
MRKPRSKTNISKYFLGLLSISSLFLLPNSAKADSPLTSTNIANYYQDIEIISTAQKTKIIDEKILKFLLSKAPLDEKSAVINALGWNFEGQNNSYLFLEGFAKSKGLKINDLTIEQLSYSDKFVLGYLLAMDDYLNLSPLDRNSSISLFKITPLELLTSVALELPDNFTAHFIRALVEGQNNLSNPESWCNIYQIHQLVLNQFPLSERNLRPLAVENIMDYINLYGEYCQGKTP